MACTMLRPLCASTAAGPAVPAQTPPTQPLLPFLLAHAKKLLGHILNLYHTYK